MGAAVMAGCMHHSCLGVSRDSIIRDATLVTDGEVAQKHHQAGLAVQLGADGNRVLVVQIEARDPLGFRQLIDKVIVLLRCYSRLKGVCCVCTCSN